MPVEVALARAGLSFRTAGGIERRLRGFQRAAPHVDFGAGHRQLAFDFGKAAALRQPPRRAGLRVSRGDKTVPAPQIAVARHQPLAGLQRARETRARFAVDEADLRQPARQLRRGLHIARQRLDARRQGGVARIGSDRVPVHGRGGIDRHVEIIAQRRAQRLFVALFHGDIIDHRRPQIARLQRQHLVERLGLGFQPLRALFRLAQCGLRGFKLGARHIARRLRGDGGGFGFGQRHLRAFDRGGERSILGASQRRQLGLDRINFAVEARDALAMLTRGVLVLLPLRGQRRERRSEIGENLFRRSKCIGRFSDARISTAAPVGIGARFFADGLFLGGQPGERCFGIGCEPLLALDVAGKLHQAHVKLGDTVLGACLLAVEVLLRDVETMESGAGARLGLAQFGE